MQGVNRSTREYREEDVKMEDMDIYVIEWLSKDRKRVEIHDTRYPEYDDACVVAESKMPRWATSYRVRMRTEAEERPTVPVVAPRVAPVRAVVSPPSAELPTTDHLMHAVYYLIKRKGGLVSDELAHRLHTDHRQIYAVLCKLRDRGIVSTASIDGHLFWIDPAHGHDE